MRKLAILALMTATALLCGEVHSQQKKNKDYYKDIKDALDYFKSDRSTDKSFALATLGLVGLEAKKQGDQALAQTLAKVGSKVTVEGMVSSNPAIRQAANDAIGSVNPTLAGPIKNLVNGGSYEQRLAGMQELGKLGANAQAAAPALVAFLKDAQATDKAKVVQTLATVGAKDPQVNELIAVMALKDPDPNVQKAAMAALTKMPAGSSAVDVFLGALKNEKDAGAKLNAIRGLSEVAKGNPAAIQELQRLAKDPNPAIAGEAKAALQKLKSN